MLAFHLSTYKRRNANISVVCIPLFRSTLKSKIPIFLRFCQNSGRFDKKKSIFLQIKGEIPTFYLANMLLNIKRYFYFLKVLLYCKILRYEICKCKYPACSIFHMHDFPFILLKR